MGTTENMETDGTKWKRNRWNQMETGKNWLGMQLMLLRDRLTGATDWTKWIEAHIDLQTGAPRGTDWQRSVQHATDVVHAALRKADAKKATRDPTDKDTEAPTGAPVANPGVQ